MRLTALLAIGLVLAAIESRAAPPEPRGPHPRLLLDNELRGAWRAQAKNARGPIADAITLCTEARNTDAHDNALYQGSEWARTLQACLVAWAATEQRAHSTTAMRFFTALIDDLDHVGDGRGGDLAARRDSGYAIRNLGPYTALAYDWLHRQMSPALRQRVRERWAAWLAWHDNRGYRARVPGTNYQAGYLAASTMIAIAQGGEAAEWSSERWKFVADELWGRDMAAALATGGILDGGDWPEGWQYGPLSVAHYALAARVARDAGIEVRGVDTWLASVLRRHVHGLTPADRVYVGQDLELEEPHAPPNVLTLAAVALGDAREEDRGWARGELARLALGTSEAPLYLALASVGPRAEVPRSSWPAWYLAFATGALLARTRWDARAVWFASECQGTLDVDHRQPKAGTFVLSRGKDDLIVDPSPYGSQSTLTSNAPSVASRQLPADYVPSQAPWGTATHWAWITRSESGVLAARCDYADAYRFQHRTTDVPEAVRDLVLLPSHDGTDAALVVIDRARTGGANHPMYLRFNVRGDLSLDGETATKLVRGSRLTITSVARTSGVPTIGSSDRKDCFDGVARGQCDAARFPASALRLELSGPAPEAIHVFDVSDVNEKPIAARSLAGDGWAGVHITSPRSASIVWPTRAGTFRYRAPAGTHVVLGAPEREGLATITATPERDRCVITIAAGGSTQARPAIFTVAPTCAVRIEPASSTALAARPSPASARRAGCCCAQPTPASPLLLSFAVLFVLRRRRQSMSSDLANTAT